MLLTKEFDYPDPWFLREFVGVINLFKPSVLIETGTYKGGMIKFISRLFPDLMIYSCDVIKQVQDVITEFEDNPNITIEQCNSLDFLKHLREDGEHYIGPFPFFFLDAHSAVVPDYPTDENLEPLAEEIKEVLKYGSSIACIHDFEVPNIPEFGHGSNDMYLKKQIKISLEVIKDTIRHENVAIYFPMLPQRLLCKDKVNWRSLFDLRGRVYLLINPKPADIELLRPLEQFGVLRRFTWPV